MSEKYYAQYVASELTRIGVNPGEGTGSDKDSADASVPGAGAGKFTVVPRKGGQGNNRLFGYDVKDANGNTVAKFGVKEKAEAEAEAARLNGGSSTGPKDDQAGPKDDQAGPKDNQTGQKNNQSIQKYEAYKAALTDPNIDLDGLIKVAREMKADTEVWNMASPGLKSQLDAILATSGK